MKPTRKEKNGKQAKALICLRVNGEPVEVAFAPHKTLLEVLREDLGLTGTKHGCELGECGCCAVLVDGRPVLSCLALGVALEGHEVTTVEGMAEGAKLHPLQEAFAELGAAQCGYCTPGISPDGKSVAGGRPRGLPANRSRKLSPETFAAAPATSRYSKQWSWLPLGWPASRPNPARRVFMGGE